MHRATHLLLQARQQFRPGLPELSRHCVGAGCGQLWRPEACHTACCRSCSGCLCGSRPQALHLLLRCKQALRRKHQCLWPFAALAAARRASSCCGISSSIWCLQRQREAGADGVPGDGLLVLCLHCHQQHCPAACHIAVRRRQAGRHNCQVAHKVVLHHLQFTRQQQNTAC